MKIKELKALQKNELQEKLVELRKELMKDNAQIALGATPKNPGKVRAVKRNIARVITILHNQVEPKVAKISKPVKKEVA